MLRRILLIASLCGLLTGCAMPVVATPPTAYPADYLPTVIFLTAQSINATISAGVTPTLTLTPSDTPIPPTPAPTSTATPAPGDPLAAIQIEEPGPRSRVVSPLQLHLLAVAGDSHKIEVALYGEDGRLLGRTIRIVTGSPVGDPLSLKMPFEIRAAGENGILQISTTDSHGRVQSLNSVGVLLLSNGVSQINPAGNSIYERVVFYGLPAEEQVSGGVLAVKGRFAALNDKPVILELVTDEGKSLGLRVLDFPGGDWHDFDTSIPYRVTEETPARLFLYQDDEVIDGRAYVYSQPLTLEP